MISEEERAELIRLLETAFGGEPGRDPPDHTPDYRERVPRRATAASRPARQVPAHEDLRVNRRERHTAVRSVTICMCRWVEYLALEADFHPPRFDASLEYSLATGELHLELFFLPQSPRMPPDVAVGRGPAQPRAFRVVQPPSIVLSSQRSRCILRGAPADQAALGRGERCWVVCLGLLALRDCISVASPVHVAAIAVVSAEDLNLPSEEENEHDDKRSTSRKWSWAGYLGLLRLAALVLPLAPTRSQDPDAPEPDGDGDGRLGASQRRRDPVC